MAAQRSDDPRVGQLVSEEAPETVLQFGTGVFLRGLAIPLFDAANKSGAYTGRVVVIGSTARGRTAELNEQDGLYSLTESGIEDGRQSSETRIISSVSRALAAAKEWPKIMDLASEPSFRIIVSNTTEVGLTLDPDDKPDFDPPKSFAGKLTSWLDARAKAFDYDPSFGCIIIPCELVEDNGDILKSLVGSLAESWELDPRFKKWVADGCHFCNTLVDRIVPGTSRKALLESEWVGLGYEDRLAIRSELFRLWAIETTDEVKKELAFLGDQDGVLLTDDVGPFRMRKVRILNGSHSIMVPIALLLGHTLVREAVEDPLTRRYIRRVMHEEIVPSLGDETEVAKSFAKSTLDRFGNPFIDHRLINIMLHATAKMQIRIAPTIVAFNKRTGQLPHRLLFGLAVFIWFRRKQGDRTISGVQITSEPEDNLAFLFQRHWNGVPLDDQKALSTMAAAVCIDSEIWGCNLDSIDGLSDAVARHLISIITHGLRPSLERIVGR